MRLTDCRKRVLSTLWEMTAEAGLPPSMRELQHRLGLASVNGVREALNDLRSMELAANNRGRSRTWRVTTRGRAALGQPGLVPLLGRVPAGEPLLSDEAVEDLLNPAGLIPPKPGLFCLRVQGDSMIGDGILDGDLVFVEPEADINPGEVIVALLDGEATVKRLVETDQGIFLMPSNRLYEPILVDEGSELRIVGKVIAVHRSMQ